MLLRAIRSNRRFSLCITVGFLLAGCDDVGAHISQRVPKTIPIERTVYSNRIWFRCAVAVYRVQKTFSLKASKRGAEFLNKDMKYRLGIIRKKSNNNIKRNYKWKLDRWRKTPVKFDSYKEMSYVWKQISTGNECLFGGSKNYLYDIFVKYINEKNDGFFSSSNDGKTFYILVPKMNLLFISSD